MTVMNNSVISWTSADELKTKELNPVRSEACLCHLSCNRGALISTVLQQITLLETIYPERAKYHDYIISSQCLSSINSIPCVLKLVVVLQQRYTNVSQFPRPICYWKWGGEPVYTNIKGVKADDSTWNNNLLSGPCIISTMWSQWLS